MRYKLQVFLIILLHRQLSLADTYTEDYTLLVQRRMQNDINIAALQITFVQDRYDDIIGIIKDRQQRVLEEITDVNGQLTMMQSVNSTYRSCVKKYKSDLRTKQQAQEQFNICLNAAENKLQQLMQDVETPFNYAKKTADILLSSAIDNCDEFSSNSTLQQECVVAKVESNSETFDGNLNKVQNNMEINLAMSSLVARNAIECSFEAEKQILVKIGRSLQLIDVCLAGFGVAEISSTIYN